MSMHNRVFDHSRRQLHARQGDKGGQGDGQGTGGGRGNQTGKPSPGEQSSSDTPPTSTENPETTTRSSSSSTETSSTTSTSSSTSTTTSTSSTSTTSTAPTSTSDTTPTSTSTSSTPLTTSESSRTTSTKSSSSSTTSQSSTSRSSAAPTIIVTTPNSLVGDLGTYSAGNTGVTQNLVPTSDTGGTQPTGTSAPAVGGSLNTGAVAGGVIGGLVGAAILVVLFMFFVRRRRAKDDASQFDAAQFRRSAMIMEDAPTGTHYPDSPPPRREMVFQGRDQVASVRSSMTAGMAGQGAWAFQANANQDDYQQYNQYAQYLDEPAAAAAGAAPVGQAMYQDQPDGKNSAEYYSDSFSQQFNAQAASSAATASRQPIQPRQQYRFGEAYGQNGNVVSDDGHTDPEDAPSVYSSQTPRQSHVENPFTDAHGRVYNTSVNPAVRNSTATIDAYGGI